MTLKTPPAVEACNFSRPLYMSLNFFTVDSGTLPHTSQLLLGHDRQVLLVTSYVCRILFFHFGAGVYCSNTTTKELAHSTIVLGSSSLYLALVKSTFFLLCFVSFLLIWLSNMAKKRGFLFKTPYTDFLMLCMHILCIAQDSKLHN